MEAKTIRFKQAIWLSDLKTQTRLAVITGINESLLSRYVTGVRVPSPKHREAIEKALNVRLDDLEG